MGVTSYFKITLITFFLVRSLAISSLDLYAETLSIKEYTIGPGDVIDIQVWDNSDLNRTVEVSQDGSFTLPLIGKVRAEGLTISELQNLIKRKLADGYLINPQVAVDIAKYQNQKVLLFGEVKLPGSYFLKGKIHILQLITQAGGFTEKAGQNIKIIRPKALKQTRRVNSPKDNEDNIIITLNLGEFKTNITSETFYVTSGDSIYVEKIPEFYVIGAVNSPGIFKWRKGLTIHQAIYLAGGPTQTAALKRTKIIRVNKKGKVKQFRIRMDDLVTPDDIIKIPVRLF